jgi:hypothetical protein
VRNVFYPHKDYSSFLSGKLTMFKLCNYRIVLAKVGRVIFRIVLIYFLIGEAYFAVCGFCRTIRAVNVYFVVDILFSCL